METTTGQFVVRCRAIIMHEGKLLVVKHSHNTSYTALPGGHVDFGEDMHTCIKRELMEELGVEAVIGRLLYVNTFTTEQKKVPVQPVEFFFEVINATDFLVLGTEGRTHAFELADVLWVDGSEGLTILPKQIGIDLVAGTLLAEGVRFIGD